MFPDPIRLVYGVRRYLIDLIIGTLHFALISILVEILIREYGLVIGIIAALIAGQTVYEAWKKMKYWGTLYLSGWLFALLFIGKSFESPVMLTILTCIAGSIIIRRIGRWYFSNRW